MAHTITHTDTVAHVRKESVCEGAMNGIGIRLHGRVWGACLPVMMCFPPPLPFTNSWCCRLALAVCLCFVSRHKKKCAFIVTSGVTLPCRRTRRASASAFVSLSDFVRYRFRYDMHVHMCACVCMYMYVCVCVCVILRGLPE